MNISKHLKKTFGIEKQMWCLKSGNVSFFLINTQIWHLITADEHKSEVILDLTAIIFDLVGQVIWGGKKGNLICKRLYQGIEKHSSSLLKETEQKL